MKKILFLIALFLNFNFAYSQTIDFTKAGNNNSNEILKNYVLEKMPDFQGNVISYYFDINNDNKKEIIGIVKSNLFYNLAGYKLIVLKENNTIWESFQNDIFFDPTQKFEIENKKITYHHTVFYKNKKYKAKIKNNKITTTKNILDIFADKKAHDIEEVTKFIEHKEHNDFNLEQFQSHQQRSVEINYKNLNEKTKHYLELK